MINRIIPGSYPGTIMVNGEEVDLRDYTQGWIWDSEIIPAGTTITAGTQLFFFQNLTFQLVAGVRKTRLDTFMTESGRLPQHWTAIVTGVGFGFEPGSTQRPEAESVMSSAYLSFILGQQRIEREGPSWLFPMPYGLSGPLALDGAGVATEVSEFQNGAIAKSAVPGMLPIYITGNFPFQMICQFDRGFGPTANNIRLYAILPAYISKPQM